MAISFKKATKTAARLRMALIGTAGSGKTYSALSIATHLAPGGRIAVIDTEHGSASKYADLFNFDALDLESFSPKVYIEAIQAAEREGYDVVIIDSLSHAWMGRDGALEQVDRIAKRQGGNSFGAWRDVTPQHNALVEAMLACRAHLITTLRAKTEYSQERDERGKTVVRKVGVGAIQRDGIEFEFDVAAEMNVDNEAVITKTRCPALAGKVFPQPGRDLAHTLRAWLSDGAPAARPAPAPQASAPADAFDHAHEHAPAETEDDAPPQHPALTAFYERIDRIELPGESVAVWIKHRSEFAALPASDREPAWKALCKKTEEVGKMKNAKVWLKKAIAEEDARRTPSALAPERRAPSTPPPPITQQVAATDPGPWIVRCQDAAERGEYAGFETLASDIAAAPLNGHKAGVWVEFEKALRVVLEGTPGDELRAAKGSLSKILPMLPEAHGKALREAYNARHAAVRSETPSEPTTGTTGTAEG